jgi:hypothetical protein
MNSFEQKIKERNNLLKSQVESLTGRSPIREVVETLLKAGVAEKDMVEKAKYVRREGAPGNYKYIYEEPKGKSGKKEEDHDFSHFTDMKKWNKLAKDPANHMTPYDKNKPVVPTQHAAGQVVREALQKENKTDKVDKNEDKENAKKLEYLQDDLKRGIQQLSEYDKINYKHGRVPLHIAKLEDKIAKLKKI